LTTSSLFIDANPVTFRPGRDKAVGQAGLDRVRGLNEHDRYRRRGFHGCHGPRLGAGDDHVGPQCDEFGRKPVMAVEVSVGVSPIDHQVAPFGPAGPGQFPEQGVVVAVPGNRPTRGVQYADAHRPAFHFALSRCAAPTKNGGRHREHGDSKLPPSTHFMTKARSGLVIRIPRVDWYAHSCPHVLQ
jgi:hypothetical protein